jgi:hypothetical protein
MKFNLPFDPWLIIFQITDKLANWPYIKLALILITVFVFVMLMAYVKVHIFKISMQGALFGFFLGMLLVIIFDILVIFALADKEKIQGLFNRDKPKEAISEVIFSGMTNLNKTLGATTTVITKKPKTVQEIIGEILLLPDSDAQKVKTLICPQ